MNDSFGISQEGLETALTIKNNYRAREPICLPGEVASLLVPEHLMNHGLDLRGIEDPLALAMMATRDPEAPMAMAAAARLGPAGRKTKLITGVFSLIGEKSRHDAVRDCVRLIHANAFAPQAIAEVRRRTARVIVETRREYTAALRHNLESLFDGSIAPRQFVREFFELTEAGNLRSDIRKKLVSSLLLSENVRPSIKFLVLENFDRLPNPVRMSIVSVVAAAEPNHHIAMIQDELRWIIDRDRATSPTH
ncbi:MAG: hypothetical protein EXQ90_05595 [Rhodospirillales bacterium]|nr:hypothetical protein [Rhodospirillales bacterium]